MSDRVDGSFVGERSRLWVATRAGRIEVVSERDLARRFADRRRAARAIRQQRRRVRRGVVLVEIPRAAALMSFDRIEVGDSDPARGAIRLAFHRKPASR